MKNEFYIIHNNQNPHTFNADIQSYLDQGWQLHGPTTILQMHDGSLMYLQPVVNTTGKNETELEIITVIEQTPSRVHKIVAEKVAEGFQIYNGSPEVHTIMVDEKEYVSFIVIMTKNKQ